MKSSFFFGTAGSLVFGMIARLVWSWDLGAILTTILFSNLAVFIGLLLTLQIERTRFFQKSPLKGPISVWILYLLSVGSVLILSIPDLRTPWVFVSLFPALLFSGTFQLPLWGKLQDTRLAHSQKKLRDRRVQKK